MKGITCWLTFFWKVLRQIKADRSWMNAKECSETITIVSCLHNAFSWNSPPEKQGWRMVLATKRSLHWIRSVRLVIHIFSSCQYFTTLDKHVLLSISTTYGLQKNGSSRVSCTGNNHQLPESSNSRGVWISVSPAIFPKLQVTFQSHVNDVIYTNTKNLWWRLKRRRVEKEGQSTRAMKM